VELRRKGIPCFLVRDGGVGKEKFWKRFGGRVMKMKKVWRQRDGSEGKENIYSKRRR